MENNEHRKYKRINFDNEILYPSILYNNTQKTLYPEQYHIHAIDLSEAGICLQTNFYIPKESFVSFYFRLEDNIPFKTLIKIRWTKVENEEFICGGDFIALKLEEIVLLRTYIDRIAN